MSKPTSNASATSETADETLAAKLTLEEQIQDLDQEILDSARRLATDPEHRARIQKLLV